jgi:hypothetical protein
VTLVVGAVLVDYDVARTRALHAYFMRKTNSPAHATLKTRPSVGHWSNFMLTVIPRKGT